MRAAAGTIKNLTLELGGNDPAIVLDDVDVDAALDRLLKGVVTRTGQICFAVKRIYVPRSIYDTFTNALCDRLATTPSDTAWTRGRVSVPSTTRSSSTASAT